MTDLQLALESGNLIVLLWTAGTLGFIHTILGPDHYIPFIMMSKAQSWSNKKTAWITFLCGIGHVGSSLLLGAFLAYIGMAANEWFDSKFAFWQDIRGSLSAWLLIGVGAAFTVWGVVNVLRGKSHTHLHSHGKNAAHTHEHDHHNDHMHPHKSNVKSLTPWILFTIFIFGPCESLIPLMLSAWSISGVAGITLVSFVFGIVTVATIMSVVFVLLSGIKRIPIGKLDKWSTTRAGISLIACGAAIQWLGL